MGKVYYLLKSFPYPSDRPRQHLSTFTIYEENPARLKIYGDTKDKRKEAEVGSRCQDGQVLVKALSQVADDQLLHFVLIQYKIRELCQPSLIRAVIPPMWVLPS